MPWFPDSFTLSAAMPDYYDRLKTGFHLNGAFHFMFRKFFGVGAEYSFFMTDVNGSLLNEYNPSFFLTGSESVRIFTNYPAVSLLFRQNLDGQGKFSLNESLSAGVLFFRLENQVTYPYATESGYRDATNNMLFTGDSFCSKLGISAEYNPVRSISLGLGGDFMFSSLKKAAYEARGMDGYSYTGKKEELPNAMKLSRFDVFLVVRFYF